MSDTTTTKIEKKPKAPRKKKVVQEPEILLDKDNPSLCEVGKVIHLRVLEDFFIEEDLPKWQEYKQRCAALKKLIRRTYNDTRPNDGLEVERVEEELKRLDLSEAEKADAMREAKQLSKLHKAIDDDRWHIREKHERERDDAIIKTVKFVLAPKKKEEGSKPSLFSRLFRKKVVEPPKEEPKPVEVEVAFAELKDHFLHTSTEDLAKQLEIIDKAIAGWKAAGQVAMVEKVQPFRIALVQEKVLVDKGFAQYLTEEQMINFIKKSERGTMVDFLRYYDGIIPDEVIKRKAEADALKIFDNYVIAYYFGDPVKKAVALKETKEKEEKEKAVKKERAKRRDPIMFGIVKGSRKLFKIADWVTETDDLTLDVIEKALGEEAKKLEGWTTLSEADSGLSTDAIGQINRQLQQLASTNQDMSSRFYSSTSAGVAGQRYWNGQYDAADGSFVVYDEAYGHR